MNARYYQTQHACIVLNQDFKDLKAMNLLHHPKIINYRFKRYLLFIFATFSKIQALLHFIRGDYFFNSTPNSFDYTDLLDDTTPKVHSPAAAAAAEDDTFAIQIADNSTSSTLPNSNPDLIKKQTDYFGQSKSSLPSSSPFSIGHVHHRQAPPDEYRIFCYELLIRVLKHNRDRVSNLWPMVRFHIIELLIRSDKINSIYVERIFVGFLSLATCTLHKQEMTSQVKKHLI